MQRKRSAQDYQGAAEGLVALPYPSLDPTSIDTAASAAPVRQGQHISGAASRPAHPSQQPSEEQLDDFDGIPSDAEASIMLLRSRLYPDAAAAAAAAAAAKSTRFAKRSKSAPGPSKATAAAVAAAAAAAAAAAHLPHIILKSQLYTVLADKTAVDRDVEQLRQNGKAKLFKLSTGADEYVVLLIGDYLKIIDDLTARHHQLAQQLQQEEQQRLTEQQQQQQQQQPRQGKQQPGAQQQRVLHSADEQQDGAPSNDTSSADHAAVAATLQLFRNRVVPACRESHITGSHLLQLLQTPPAASGRSAGRAAAGHCLSGDAVLRRLLSAELVARDSRSPDSYMFTVPGAAAFVKSVVAGRQELLQLLQRKKYQEVLEKELMCVSLRGSVLSPSFHLRDLQGRGLVSCIDTTAGKLVRLAWRKR